MMIKLVSLLTRKEGLTHEQFVKHWAEVHAPFARAVSGIRRYVQYHITGTRTRADISKTEVEIDDIAELWYGNLDALQRFAAAEDARRLTQMGRCLSGGLRFSLLKKGRLLVCPDLASGESRMQWLREPSTFNRFEGISAEKENAGQD